MKRYVTMAEYQRLHKLSYPTVKHGLETGQIRGIKTEAGHWKVDTAVDSNTDTAAIIERLESQERMLKALCKHFNAAGV